LDGDVSTAGLALLALAKIPFIFEDGHRGQLLTYTWEGFWRHVYQKKASGRLPVFLACPPQQPRQGGSVSSPARAVPTYFMEHHDEILPVLRRYKNSLVVNFDAHRDADGRTAEGNWISVAKK
jgi:hypothetical protein